LGKENLHN